MMKTLVIDTATPACSVALFDGDIMLSGEYVELGRGHAERLIPMIAKLPDSGKADEIWVNIGPGSFTGIRVGISAARALALAWNVKCHGYGCLQLVAAIGQKRHNSPNPIDVVMQGGHGEYFFQSFDEAVNMQSQAKSLNPEDAAQMSQATFIAGNAAQELAKYKTDITSLNILPDARQWVLLDHTKPLAPSALYIRPADAKLPKGRT